MTLVRLPSATYLSHETGLSRKSIQGHLDTITYYDNEDFKESIQLKRKRLFDILYKAAVDNVTLHEYNINRIFRANRTQKNEQWK